MKKILILLFISYTLILASGNSMSKKNYKALMEAQKLIDKGDLKKAKNTLLPLLEQTSINAYEKSYVLQTLANVYINEDNYKKSAKYYEEIIKLNSLDPKNIENIKLSLSKIYLSLNAYKKSIKLSEQLLKTSTTIPKEVIYENLLYANYYNNGFKRSIFYSKKLFEQKVKRKESWYQITYSSYVELKQYKNAIKVLETMVKKWHNKENYWLQLIALYQQTNNYKKALSTFELAYKRKGVNPEKNSLYFINILLENGLYYKAAKNIEKGLEKGYLKNNKKTFDLLVSCYDYAKQKDKVIELLSTSEYGRTARYQLLLANIYYNNEKYKKSIKALKSVSIKAGTKASGQRDTLLALSYYELNNKQESKKYIKKAINNPHEKRRALRIQKSLRI